MRPVPPKIKYGNVVRYAILGDDTALTGNTKRFVDGAPLFIPAALAIVHYEMSQGGVYLYYCDENWRVQKDTWHYSIADAQERADYEFANVAWQFPRAAN